jgi:gas vesicle protein
MNDYKKYGEYSKESTQSHNLKVALTFLAIGAGIGALISLLVSPRSGREIRQAVRGKFDDARRGLNQQTSRLRRTAGQAREKVMSISRPQ